MEDFSVPEVQRCNLEGMIITLKSLGIDDFVNLDFIEAPNDQRLICALNNIYSYGAMD